MLPCFLIFLLNTNIQKNIATARARRQALPTEQRSPALQNISRFPLTVRHSSSEKLSNVVNNQRQQEALLNQEYTIGQSIRNRVERQRFDSLGNLVGQQVNKYNALGELTNSHDNYTLTTGTRITYNKEKIGVDFSGYYQLGASSEYVARDVAAYNLNIAVSYKVTDKIKATLGYAMLSGNDKTDTTANYAKTEHAFNPFFGTNHKFNGFMDYFYVGNHSGNIGLNDAFLKLDYKHAKFTAGITAHAFLANANILDSKALSLTGEIKAMDPYLGTELDVYGAFKLVPSVTCKVGYSQMFGTTSMEAIKGGDMNEISNWGYVMLIMKPTLFQGK